MAQNPIDAIYFRAIQGKTEEQRQNIAYLFNKPAVAGGCFKSAQFMTDEEYMRRVMEKKKSLGLFAKAIEQLGLDPETQWEIPPIELQNFIYEKEWVKQTKNGNWVSSAYQVTWLFFTDDQICIYQMIFNTDENPIKDMTEEYYYQDVTAVSVRTETETSTQINGTTQNVQTTKLGLVVPGSTYMIAVNDNDNAFREAVKAMRFKIKDKKSNS